MTATPNPERGAFGFALLPCAYCGFKLAINDFGNGLFSWSCDHCEISSRPMLREDLESHANRRAQQSESQEVRIRTRCPSCGHETLFISPSGHLTCSLIGCKDPTLINRIGEDRIQPKPPGNAQATGGEAEISFQASSALGAAEMLLSDIEKDFREKGEVEISNQLYERIVAVLEFLQAVPNDHPAQVEGGATSPASPPTEEAIDAIAKHLMDSRYVVWAGKSWDETPEEYYRNVFRERARKLLSAPQNNGSNP